MFKVLGFKTQPGAWFIIRIGYLPTHPCFPIHVCIPYYGMALAHITEKHAHRRTLEGIYVLCLSLYLQKHVNEAFVVFKHHMHQIYVLVKFLFDGHIARCVRKLRLLRFVFSAQICYWFCVLILEVLLVLPRAPPKLAKATISERWACSNRTQQRNHGPEAQTNMNVTDGAGIILYA